MASVEYKNSWGSNENIVCVMVDLWTDSDGMDANIMDSVT